MTVSATTWPRSLTGIADVWSEVISVIRDPTKLDAFILQNGTWRSPAESETSHRALCSPFAGGRHSHFDLVGT